MPMTALSSRKERREKHPFMGNRVGLRISPKSVTQSNDGARQILGP